MTVEELLKQLEHERELEYFRVFRYGAEKQEAMFQDDMDDMLFYKGLHDKSCKEIERLGIIIKELKKRVS